MAAELEFGQKIGGSTGDANAPDNDGCHVVYARVSSADQKDDLDRQVGRVVEWATQQGFPPDEVVLETDVAEGRVRLCFGSGKLWHKQHNLEANGYGSHEEWLADWRDACSDEFFVLGSRDETGGCQLCVASVADNGSLTLRMRMPDCLVSQDGKYLTIQGVRFAYGHEQVLAALDSNDEYSRHRREHGEKSARTTDLARPSATGSSGTTRAGGCSLPLQ